MRRYDVEWTKEVNSRVTIRKKMGDEERRTKLSVGQTREYIRKTYKCQNGRENAALKGRILGSYDEGLPGEEV